MADPFVSSGDLDADGVLHLDLPRKQWQAIAKARFAGQRVDVELRARKDKRSVRANAALHAGLQEWAHAKGLVGPAATTFIEDMKDDLLALCWGYVVRQSLLTGEITKRLVEPHTANLSVEKFSTLFEQAVQAAAEQGHVWILPDDLKPTRVA
jgi:hypothetical protein